MSTSSNQKYQKTLKQREELRRLNQENDFKFVMSHIEGRRFLYWLLYDVCGLQGTTLGALSTTLHEVEGRRSVGADILVRAQEICPPETIIMIREAIEWASEERELIAKAKEVASREDD